jgi:cyclopropane fatty-acyl-phospholipid synthase-like methyltransferase
MTAPWMLDELAHAGPEHLDDAFVAGYDRKQGHPPVDDDLTVFQGHHALGPGTTVVDLGAGTGRFARAAAARGGQVVAVEISPAMQGHIEREAAREGLSTLRVVPAGFLSYRHDGPPVNGVFTRNALHQVPDFWKGLALVRIHSILERGAVLRLHDLVYDMEPAEAPEALEEWMAAAVNDPAAGYTREDFETHVRTELSTYRWLLEHCSSTPASISST